MQGKIIKGVGGLYTVCDGEKQVQCWARGRFRKDKRKPVIGDRVVYQDPVPGDDFGTVDEILPRQNCMIRPSVANIDLLFVTVAAMDPVPDLLLADRLFLYARMAGIAPEFLVNKSDLADAQGLLVQYSLSGYQPLSVSAQTGQGLEALLERMKGKVCAFCGQSGVGKSSILNAIMQESVMETGGISRIARGRHTTRHVELICLDGGETWVADTPGFSLLETDVFDPEHIKDWYPEYEPYEGECRFLGCNHVSEPGCAVKQAAQDGALSADRLERYAQLFKESTEKWSRRYD